MKPYQYIYELKKVVLERIYNYKNQINRRNKSKGL